MAASKDTTTLAGSSRTAEGSRATRRLRRSGRIPGVVYGGGEEPLAFDVDARDLRIALAGGGAVIELTLEGGKAEAVVLKDEQRHPVNSATMHVDFLRVDLNKPIQATTVLELTGGENAPGVKEGGVLEHVTHELNIEALPADIPDSISHDVSAMEINDTVMLSAVVPPAGVTLLDDLEHTVIANLSPPRVEVEESSEIEEETAVVGEETSASGDDSDSDDGDGDSGDDADADADQASE
ncbi:MAG: 50S ribosomal protein L25 [Actinomycetota bacterium]